MPINREKFKSGEIIGAIGKDAIEFLDNNSEEAFTPDEILRKIGFVPVKEQKDLWRRNFSSIYIMAFDSLLQRLVDMEKIQGRKIKDNNYYASKHL